MTDSPQFQKILCPVDFSEPSRQALRWAGSLARAFGGHVTVLHAERFELPWEFTPDMTASLAAALAQSRETVADQVASEAKGVLPDGVAYDAVVADNVPTEAIAAKATDMPADLLVMGSHGHSGLRRLLAGSVTEEVVRRVACPVLVVRGKPTAELPHPKRILCPVNRTELARQLLRLAGTLARAYDADVVLLHSMDPDDHERAAREESAAAAMCSEMAAEVGGQCNLTQVVREGNAAEQIVAVAREQGADLTLVGARLRPFLDVTVFGTTTERVMRHAPTPVLVVPGQ